MTVAATVREPQDERIVEEAHCTECGVPLTSIPGWYATVNVRFTCDSCRQKAGRNVATVTPLELDAPRSGVADSDNDAEPALDEIDDVDLELDETEAEAETE